MAKRRVRRDRGAIVRVCLAASLVLSTTPLRADPFSVSSGTYVTSTNYDSIQAAGTSQVTVTGGLISGVMVAQDSAILNTSGGTFSGAVTIFDNADAAFANGRFLDTIDVTDNANLLISGGTYSGSITVRGNSGGTGGSLTIAVAANPLFINTDVSVLERGTLNLGKATIGGGLFVDSALGTVNITDSSTINNVNGAQISGTLTIANGVQLTTSAFAVNSGGKAYISTTNAVSSAIQVNSGGTLSLNGNININNKLTSTSSGILALDTTNSTLTGVNSSTMFIGSTGTSAFTGSVLAAGSGNNYRLGGGGGSLMITNTNVITGANGLIIGSTQSNGFGTVVIANAQNFSGNTTIDNGILSVTSTGTLGTSNVFINSGGTLLMASTNNISNAPSKTATINSGGILGINGNLNIAARVNAASTGIIALNTTNSTFTNSSSSTHSAFIGSLGDYAWTMTNIGAGTGSTYRLGGAGGTLRVTANGALVGANALIVGSTQTNGGGTVIISGSNSYSGGTTVTSSGILKATAGAQLGTGNVTVGANGQLNLAAASNIASGSSVTVQTGGSLVLDANFDPSSILNASSSGLLLLNADNSTLTGLSGTMFLGASGNYSLLSATYNPGSGSTYRLGGGPGVLTIANGLLTGANQLLIGSSQTNGTGTVVLGAAQSYTGATTIDYGVLRVGTTNALPSATALTINSNGTLDVNGLAATVGSVTGAGGVTLGNGGSLTVGDATSTTYTGVITGSNANFTKQGAGSLALTANQTFTGTANVLDGTLLLASTTPLSSGSTLNVNGATAIVDLGSGNRSVGTLNVASGTVQNGTISAGAFNVQSGITTAAFTGTGAVNKTGVGTFVLGASSSFSGGALVQAGTLQLGGADYLPTTSSLYIAGSGTFDLNNNNQTVGALTGSGNVTLGTGTLSVSTASTTTFDGNISGSGGFNKLGNGTVALTGSSSYTGTTNITAGTLYLAGADNRLSSSSSINIAGPGKLQLDGISQTLLAPTGSGQIVLSNNANATFNTPTATTFSGDVVGTGSFTKIGAGTLNVLSNMGYTGATNINEGTFQLIMPEQLPSTTMLTVAAGATFDMNNNQQSVGGLSGAGTVNMTNTNFQVGDLTSTFTGALNATGTATLVKRNSGTLNLVGNFTVPQLTFEASGGTLNVIGSLNVSNTNTFTTQSNSTLLGNGTITGRIASNTNGLIRATGQLYIGLSSTTSGYSTSGNLDVNSQNVVLMDSDGATLGQYTTITGGTLSNVSVANSNGINVSNPNSQVWGFGTLSTRLNPTSNGLLLTATGGTLAYGLGSTNSIPGPSSTNSRFVVNSGATLLNISATGATWVLASTNLLNGGAMISTTNAANPFGSTAPNTIGLLGTNNTIYGFGTLTGRVNATGSNVNITATGGTLAMGYTASSNAVSLTQTNGRLYVDNGATLVMLTGTTSQDLTTTNALAGGSLVASTNGGNPTSAPTTLNLINNSILTGNGRAYGRLTMSGTNGTIDAQGGTLTIGSTATTTGVVLSSTNGRINVGSGATLLMLTGTTGNQYLATTNALSGGSLLASTNAASPTSSLTAVGLNNNQVLTGNGTVSGRFSANQGSLIDAQGGVLTIGNAGSTTGVTLATTGTLNVGAGATLLMLTGTSSGQNLTSTNTLAGGLLITSSNSSNGLSSPSAMNLLTGSILTGNGTASGRFTANSGSTIDAQGGLLAVGLATTNSGFVASTTGSRLNAGSGATLMLLSGSSAVNLAHTNTLAGGTFLGSADGTNPVALNLLSGQNLAGSGTASGQFNALSGSVISSSNGTLAVGLATTNNGFVASAAGSTLNVNSGSSLMLLSGSSTVNLAQTNNMLGGSLMSSSDGVNANGLNLGSSQFLTGNGTVTGQFNALSGSTITASGGVLAVGNSALSNGFVANSTGTLLWANSGATLLLMSSASGGVNLGTTNSLTGGTIQTTAPSMNLGSGQIIMGNGTVSGQVRSSGTLMALGGTLAVGDSTNVNGLSFVGGGINILSNGTLLAMSGTTGGLNLASSNNLAGGVLQTTASGFNLISGVLTGNGTVSSPLSALGGTITATGGVLAIGDATSANGFSAASTGSTIGAAAGGTLVLLSSTSGGVGLAQTNTLTGGLLLSSSNAAAPLTSPGLLNLRSGQVLTGFGTVSGPLAAAGGSTITATTGVLAVGTIDSTSGASLASGSALGVGTGATLLMLTGTTGSQTLASTNILSGGTLAASGTSTSPLSNPKGLILASNQVLSGNGTVSGSFNALGGSITATNGRLTLGNAANATGLSIAQSNTVVTVGTNATLVMLANTSGVNLGQTNVLSNGVILTSSSAAAPTTNLGGLTLLNGQFLTGNGTASGQVTGSSGSTIDAQGGVLAVGNPGNSAGLALASSGSKLNVGSGATLLVLSSTTGGVNLAQTNAVFGGTLTVSGTSTSPLANPSSMNLLSGQTLVGNGTVTGRFNASTGSTISATGGQLAVGLAGTNSGFSVASNGTTLTVAAGATLNLLSNTSGGVNLGQTNSLSGGVLQTAASGLNLLSGQFLTGNGTASGNLASGGTINATGGTLTVGNAASASGFSVASAGTTLSAGTGSTLSMLTSVTGGVNLAQTNSLGGGVFQTSSNSFNLLAGQVLTGNGTVSGRLAAAGGSTITASGGVLAVGTTSTSDALALSPTSSLAVGSGATLLMYTGTTGGQNLTQTTTLAGGTLAVSNTTTNPLTNVSAMNLLNNASLVGNGTVSGRFAGAAGSTITANGSLSIGLSSTSSGFATAGALNVGSNTVTLRSSGVADLGSSTTLSGGTLAAANGVRLSSGDNLNGSGRVDGAFEAQASSTVTLTGNLRVGKATSSSGVVIATNINIGSNTFTLDDLDRAQLGPTTTMSGGTIAAANGVQLTTGSSLVGTGTLTGQLGAANNTTVNVASTGSGQLTVTGGLGIDASSTLTKTGTGTLNVAGQGSIGSGGNFVINAGTVNLQQDQGVAANGPGQPATANLSITLNAGTLNISGSHTLKSLDVNDAATSSYVNLAHGSFISIYGNGANDNTPPTRATIEQVYSDILGPQYGASGIRMAPGAVANPLLSGVTLARFPDATGTEYMLGIFEDIIGDIDGDATVTTSDLAILLSNLGVDPASRGFGFFTSLEGDLDGDGLVTTADLGKLLNHLGQSFDPFAGSSLSLTDTPLGLDPSGFNSQPFDFTIGQNEAFQMISLGFDPSSFGLTVTGIPEPSGLLMLAAAAVAVGGLRRRKPRP